MIARKLLGVGLVGALALPLLTGCGGYKQIMGLEIRDLKGRVAHLETLFGRHEESIREIQSRGDPVAPADKIAPMQAAPMELPHAQPAPRKASPMARLSTRQVQIALRQAGKNPGPIDGRMGKRTVAALRAFQRSHGLSVTGRPDTKTMSVLRDYL